MKHVTIPDQWSGGEALSVVTFLEKVIEAVWRAHGARMAPYFGAPPPRPRELPLASLNIPHLLDDEESIF